MADEYEELLHGYEFFIGLMKNHGKSVDEAISQVKNMFKGSLGDRIVEYWRELVIRAADPSAGVALIKGVGAAEAWYPGPRANDVYWSSLRDHLIHHPTHPWTQSDVDDLDAASNVVLASCRSPWTETSSGRGLVVGHVQSGKTTNFTAVMAKAADAGFRLFIVLSGTTTSLRRQTQVRLEQQLANLNPHAWYFHTTADRDIGRRTNWVPFLAHRQMRTCIVVKKNTTRLRNLKESLDRADELGFLDDCPILVIDDEGDNASISPNCEPEQATAINQGIVAVLDRPRVSYVAYTATPFANCFVDPGFEANLFPRDFIVALPEPPDYFGTRRMFGEDGMAEIAAVVDVPDLEAPGYLPPPPDDTHSLERSIRWFLMAATARRIRSNGAQPHTTMLVNVSEFTEIHAQYWRVVRDIVVRLADGITSGDQRLVRELEEQWNDETILVDPSEFGNPLHEFEAILAELTTTIGLLGPLHGADHNSNDDCAIVVDNSKSAVRLAYDDEAPRPVIVIGGNTMSRGLTLEGLVTTFFLRSGKLYDTLLQMGRWFGYRRGYEDLFRVYMPRELRGRFEFLTKVERELRDWIQIFARTGKSPLELGPKFRMHPQMQVTRSSLMGRVKVTKLDLSGTQPETSYFENTDEAVGRSKGALVSLVAGMSTVPFEDVAEGRLFRDVPADVVARFFLPSTGVHIEGHAYLTNENFLRYLEVKLNHGELETWNVLLRKIRNGKPIDFLPDSGGTLVTRTRKSTYGDFVDIGSLADSGDKWVDVPADQESSKERYRSSTPLLVVYVIDKDSVPNSTAAGNGRSPLGAVDHFVGAALYFPLSTHDDDLGHFVAPKGPWDDVKDDETPEPDPDDDDEGDVVDDPPVPV